MLLMNENRKIYLASIYLFCATLFWAKVFDYYYRGYDGSNMYSKVTFTMEDTDKIFAVAELLENILETDHGIKDFQIAVVVCYLHSVRGVRREKPIVSSSIKFDVSRRVKN